MSNHHLRNKALSLKAKGLLSLMLSLPDNWDYTLRGLTAICKEGIDAVRVAVCELEGAGYIIRTRKRNAKGQLAENEYVILEYPGQLVTEPAPISEKPARDVPVLENPTLDIPTQANPALGKPIQTNTNIPNTNCIKNESNQDGWIDGYARTRERIMEQIDYDTLAMTFDRAVLTEVVGIMAEIMVSRSDSFTIEGREYPSQLVKQRMMAIDYFGMETFMNTFKRISFSIRNPKAYIISSLFNIPVTSDVRVDNEVRCGLYRN